MMPPNNPDGLDLERELRQALRRIEPQRDFSTLTYSRNRWTPSRSLLALAAAIILMIALPVEVGQYQARRQRREEARADVIQALRITQSKLEKTRQMVVRQLDRRNAL
jgi:sensor domain CHASE-containing protein